MAHNKRLVAAKALPAISAPINCVVMPNSSDWVDTAKPIVTSMTRSNCGGITSTWNRRERMESGAPSAISATQIAASRCPPARIIRR